MKNRRLFGILVGFCFNIVGLFAGFLFEKNSDERDSFITGWTQGFIAFVVVAVAIVVLVLGINKLK